MATFITFTVLVGLSRAAAQGSLFTYQGRLPDGRARATGSEVADNQAGGSGLDWLMNSSVSIRRM